MSSSAEALAAGPGPALVRPPQKQLTLRRMLWGGRPTDLGRLPRYMSGVLMGCALIWAPIVGYVQTAPLSFTSEFTLILPGAGAAASVNLSEIGQASSFASSPYASPSVSPTETYKRLLGADRILRRAADAMDLSAEAFGTPRTELVDQTGLIRVKISGPSSAGAQRRGTALLAAFFAELGALRADERRQREASGAGAIAEFRASVLATREEIERLQRDTGLITVDQYGQLVAETDALRARHRDLATDLSERAATVAALSAALSITPRLAAATLKLHADTEFTALIDDMAAKSAALSEASGAFGPNHPRVAKARKGQAAARSAARARAAALTGLPGAMLDQLDLAPIGGRAALLARLVEADAARAGLAAETAELARRLGADDARVAALLGPAAQLEDLQRDFQVAEAVFASALARAETSKSDVYASYPLVQVLETPSHPSAPTSPRRRLALAAGGAATFMVLVGSGLAWARRPLLARLLAEPESARP